MNDTPADVEVTESLGTNGQRPDSDEYPFGKRATAARVERQRAAVAAHQAGWAAVATAQPESTGVTEDRLKRWAWRRYDPAELDGRREQWAWKIRTRISDKNAARDAAKYPPILMFTGDDAVKAGATDEELATLTPLTPAEQGERYTRATVEMEAARLRVRELARAVRVDVVELPPVNGLAGFLAESDDPDPFTVEQVIPSGGARIVLAAPAKAGKTTLVGNLVRSLVDGDPFLGAFPVHVPARRVAVIDNEMSRDMLRAWLRSQGIRNAAGVVDVQAMRGRAGAFDITSDRVRAMWARRFADLGADFIIFDCLAPVLDALGLDANTEARKFLGPFDALMAEAGITDALIAHHMGHSNERARGDSNIIGWSDGNWKIVTDENGSYFSATTRGGDVAEGLLRFDTETRRLTYAGGDRAESRTREAVEDRLTGILNALADHAAASPEDTAPEMTTTAIGAAVGGRKEIVTDALNLAVERGKITRRSKGRAVLYALAPDGVDPTADET